MVPMVGITMESIKRATVWEAVPELNSRTLFGRVVVNPPERRAEVKAFPTLDTWYFCKCGKAFQNVERYKEHKNAGGGCQKKIQLQVKKSKKVKSITIAKTDDETYEIVDMPEKKLRRARISHHENKGRVLKSRISNEPKARISYDQKSSIYNEQKSRIGNEQKSRIGSEQKSRIGNEHMSRLLKAPKSRTPNNDHRLQIPHDRSQQKSGGIKLKNTLTVTKPNREVPRGMQGFIFRSNPTTRSTVAVQRSQISERIDLFECRKCGKMFETLRTYRIHYTRMHVQVRTNTSPSVVLSGSPTLKTVKQASRLTKTQDQLTSETRIRQTFPGQKIGQKKAKGLKTKSMNMLMTKSGKVVGTKRCETCNLDFTHNVGYFMHMRCKHEGRGILKCENCTYKTLSQDGMEAHMKRFHRQRPTSFHLSLRSKDTDPESPMSQNKEHLTDSGQNTVDNVEMADETVGISSRKIHQRNGARLPKCYWCKMRFQSTSELLVHSAFAHPHPRSQRKSSTVLSTPSEEAVLSTHAEEAVLSTPAEEVYLSTRAKTALSSKPVKKAVLSKPAEEAILSKPIEEAIKSSERLPTSSLDSSTLKGRESIARRISRCRHCSHRFENMTALDDHIKLAHPAKNLSTSKIIVSRRRIVKPIPAPNEESGHVHGRSRRSVVRRRYASTSAGMPICTICRKRCRSSSQLRAHTRTHFEVSCEKCHWKFGCKKSLNRHLTNAHVPDGKFPCTLCICSYRNNMGLASHMWHHHGMRGVPANAEDKPEDPPTPTEVSLDDKNEIPTQPESCSDDPPRTSQDEVSRTSAAEKQKASKKPEHIQNEPDRVLINGNMYNRCDICQQWIPHSQVDRHKRAAHEGGEFHCDKCSCVFRKLGSLVSHQNAMHRENTIKHSFFAEQLGEKTPGSPLRKPVEKSVKELPGTEESTNSVSSKTAQEDMVKKRLSPLRSLICSVCKMRVSGGVRGMLQHKKIAHPHSGAYKFSTLKSNWAENLQDKSKAGGPISKANEERKDEVAPSFVQNLRARLEGNCKGSESAAVRFQDLAQNSLGSMPSKQTCETVPQIVNFFSQNANYVKQFSTTQAPPKIPSAFEKSKLIHPRGVLKQKSGETEKSALNSLAKKITPKESLDVRPSEKTSKELIRRPVLTYMFGEERKEMSTRDTQSCIMKSRQNFPSSDNNIRKSQLLLLPPPTIKVSSSEFKLPRNLEKGAFKISNELTVSRVIPNLIYPVPPRNIHHQDASSVSNKQQHSRGLEFISGSINPVENDALKRLRGNPEVSIFPVAQKGMSPPMEATRSDQVMKPLAANSHVQCNIVPNAAKPKLGMCPKCKKSFFNRNRLMEHIDSCQVQPAAGMKCGYCGNNFSHDLLIAHMQECGRKQLA